MKTINQISFAAGISAFLSLFFGFTFQIFLALLAISFGILLAELIILLNKPSKK